MMFEKASGEERQQPRQGETAREIERLITPNRKAPEKAGRESDSKLADAGTSPEEEKGGSRRR
jgi:hypothetical protein